MSLHSNKYYHLIKALRVQKQQSEISKVLRENKIQRQRVGNGQLTPEKIANIIDLDNSTEMNDKDSKVTIKLTDNDSNQAENSRLWRQFQKRSLTLKLTPESLPIQQKIAQTKDEKLIDVLLAEANKDRQNKESQLAQLNVQIREDEEEVTVLKQQAIELGLQIEGIDKELIDLKADFDREEKKINERSTKYKQEKSKDIMIKNIDRDDMEMRKAMASRIKLNQELDFGFQVQRRRAFNQAKAAINERKKALQDKLTKLKTVINKNQQGQSQLIATKVEIEAHIEKLGNQQIYFCKQIVKRFKGHSRGIQWLTKLLQNWGVKVQKQDLPEGVSKDDAAFVTTLISESKPYMSERKSKPMTTPKSFTFKKLNQHFQTQPNLAENIEKRNKSSLEKKKFENKTTVYFDIESQGGNKDTREMSREKAVTSFNINTKSLKKIYEHAGHVIGHMIKNHSMSYNSCRAINPTTQVTGKTSLLQRTAIEDKIKAKFINIRQKDRRDNLKKLLFGNS